MSIKYKRKAAIFLSRLSLPKNLLLIYKWDVDSLYFNKHTANTAENSFRADKVLIIS